MVIQHFVFQIRIDNTGNKITSMFCKAQRFAILRVVLGVGCNIILGTVYHEVSKELFENGGIRFRKKIVS